MISKICTKCKEEFPATLEYFPKDNRRENGLRAWCRLCTKEYNKEYKKKYREENKNKIKEDNKKWRKDNPNHNKEYGKKWREENPEYEKKYREKNNHEIRKYQQKYHKKWQEKNRDKINKNSKERRKADPQFRLRMNFSSRMRYSLRKQGTSKKGYSWEKIVGYSVKDLMERLESLFTEGMCWDNYGEWHIDHIIPVTFFNFSSYEDDEFQECWALPNLQPLWAIDNFRKSNKRGYVNG